MLNAAGVLHLSVWKAENVARNPCAWQGKLEEADSLLKRCIEILENALGHDHPNLAISLDTRGVLLKAQVWLGSVPWRKVSCY